LPESQGRGFSDGVERHRALDRRLLAEGRAHARDRQVSGMQCDRIGRFLQGDLDVLAAAKGPVVEIDVDAQLIAPRANRRGQTEIEIAHARVDTA
jgi:hypothetical protein